MTRFRLPAARSVSARSHLQTPASPGNGCYGTWMRDGMKQILAWVVVVLGTAIPGLAQAQLTSWHHPSIVMDAGSGRVLSANQADELHFPASLTKLMTLYLAFEALRDHRITLDQAVPVSWHAASMAPVKLGLPPGALLTVEQTILAMVTLSANDAACALGELLGGDEERFAQMMTLRARSLGMTNSTFRNASGLPEPYQVSTAHDLVTLADHLIHDFPGEYQFFSVPEFRLGNRVIHNHDTMLRTYPGADGLKTGYTVAAGRNLVTSAVRGGVRLVGVVLGARSNTERDAEMTSLLDAGFERMDVPIAPARPMRSRLPLLMSSAEAAPVPFATKRKPGRDAQPAPSVQVAHMRGRLGALKVLRYAAVYYPDHRTVSLRFERSIPTINLHRKLAVRHENIAMRAH